jgi:poly-gamma-glutamate synthesis protein (capsule biosynthesis protein)
VFLCGDVMTGRGIDQIMPKPCDPILFESYVQSALDYVRLAEAVHGAIPRNVGPSYVWGAALEELARARPDIRIINLETSITHSDDYMPKGINYRMSPENAPCLAASAPDCCVLANNHVLDWGRDGLFDTLANLERLCIKTAGAGRNLAQASAPAILEIADAARVLVFAFGSPTSGVPRSWAATESSAGVNVLTDLSERSARRVADQIAAHRRANDFVVVSVHWGANWGYDVSDEQRYFAHALIDNADVCLIHGHSSHHPKPIEVYRNRLILYGCGDFLSDYEGIKGNEEFRSDLALMYFADLRMSGDLAALEIVPLRIRKCQLIHASSEEADWVRETLDRESGNSGVHVRSRPDGRLTLSWPTAPKS